MNKLKHTPGPWKFSQGFIGSRHCMFVSCDPYKYDGMHIHNGEKMGEKTDESEANARLIASAPEILESLILEYKFIKEWASAALPEKIFDDLMITKLKVIEKATGMSIDEVLQCQK